MDCFRSWRRRLETFVRLPRGERGLLIESFLLLPLVEISLKIFGFKRTLRVMEWGVSRRRRKEPTPAPEQVESTVRLVSIAARHGIHKAGCLRRAMVAWFLLRRQGIRSELRIGVCKDDAGTLEAHAWVEHEGKVIADPEAGEGRYKALEGVNPGF